LFEEGAYFYICGDAANMVLGEIIETERGLKPDGGDEVVKMLRASNMYSPSLLCGLTWQVFRGRLVLICISLFMKKFIYRISFFYEMLFLGGRRSS
jgi:hypothetical protein